MDLILSMTFYFFAVGCDARSGSRVHEIPFQFDLMKLLPKCQQIEMVFLMLTRGKLCYICVKERISVCSLFLPNNENEAYL